MIIRIPEKFLYQFLEKLLREVDIPASVIDDNLESFVYESGAKRWDNETSENEIDYFIIEWDPDD